MNWEQVLSLAAVLVALVSALIAWISVRQAKRSADAAEAQVVGQREAREAAAQPYVWADVRANVDQGTLLELVLGNAGPTVATDVRVTFDPPLPLEDRVQGLTDRAVDRLSAGIDSLAPGTTRRWTIGRGSKLLGEERNQPHRVLIDATGPFGPVERLSYIIDLDDIRESIDSPTGNLHRLTKAVEGVAKEIRSAREAQS